MIVGEAWGADEERAGEPFVGVSGQELNRMLHEAGILRTECFLTNLVNARPPLNDIGQWVALKKKDISPLHVPLKDKMVLPHVVEGYRRLLTEIDAVRPNVIIALGNVAMWALTGNSAITKWRGSLLKADLNVGFLPGESASGGPSNPKVIPTYHPAAVLRQWSWRAIVLNDLRRVKQHMTSRSYAPPEWKFITRPSFTQAQEVFTSLLSRLDSGESLWIDFDVETRLGHISCFGISWSAVDAICIPLMYSSSREGYWSEDEEAWIVWMLYRVSTHKLAQARWQNGLYDAQYTYRHWHFIPRGVQDTMISQHALFSDQPKALHHQASMYCNWYVYWKDEGKDFNTGGRDEAKGWYYNCEDCVYTRECGEVEFKVAKQMGLEEVHAFQQRMFYPVLKAMTRGIRPDLEAREALAREIAEQIEARKAFLLEVLGHPININSPKQLCALFYEDLGLKPIMSRAKKGQPAHVTVNDEALQKISVIEPLFKPLVNAISDINTLEIFHGMVMMKLDTDGRIRCSFNIGGSESGKTAPKTYRLSASKSAFDCGGNLQVIPSEKSKSVGKWKQRGHMAMLGDPYELPNIRSLFAPDPGFDFFDMDLDRADLQVMAWDAEEEILKAALKLGVDLHLLNVYVLDGKDPPPLEELVETHPKYPDHRGPRKMKREFAKVFCHATDYLGKARTVAAATGRTVHEVDRGQKIYLSTYSGIKRWQDRIIEQVRKHRFVENKFGYRWYIFDRIDDTVMPEAVAWIPQSTVSVLINKIWEAVDREVPEVQVLLQVHDSLAGQFPSHRKDYCVPRILQASKILIPYDDPLIIPVGISTSPVSWGACA